MEAKCGKEKNGDAVVCVQLSGTGIEVKVESKIKQLFGKHMEEAVREACSELHINNAQITVKDFGALDFVIKARTKTAIKSAGKQV
jgi:citrate lyase subunit gamma (acyl carrier protein)